MKAAPVICGLGLASTMLLAAANATMADANGAWIALPNTNAPPAREGHVMVYDPVGDRLIVHGGRDLFQYFDDVWAYPLATSGPWQQLSPAGRKPAPRTYHAAMYDPLRQRILIHGGQGGAAFADLWALDLAGPVAWDSLAPGGSVPGARWWQSLVYDPVNDRALLYAGAGGSPDLFELQLGAGADGTWVPLFPAPAPASRCCHEAAFDSATFSMVMFGGWNGDELEDLWAYNDNGPLGGWSSLLATGPDRTDHVAVIDRKRHRLVTHGGIVHPSALSDVWAASLDAPVSWTPLTPAGIPPDARNEHAAIYDAKRDRMIVFGGRGGGPLNDLWALDFSVNVTVYPDLPHPRRLAIERARAIGDAIELDLSLANESPLRIELIDVTGRRIAQQSALASAQLRVPIDAGSGVYFLRVRQGAQEAHGRVAIVR